MLRPAARTSPEGQPSPKHRLRCGFLQHTSSAVLYCRRMRSGAFFFFQYLGSGFACGACTGLLGSSASGTSFASGLKPSPAPLGRSFACEPESSHSAPCSGGISILSCRFDCKQQEPSQVFRLANKETLVPYGILAGRLSAIPNSAMPWMMARCRLLMEIAPLQVVPAA